VNPNNPYHATMTSAEGATQPKSRLKGLLLGFVSAILGFYLAAIPSLALALNSSMQIGLSVAGAILCVVCLRNRLLYLFAMLIVAYPLSAVYSHNKISNFCSSIAKDTNPAKLSELADKAGVKFHAFPMPEKPGTSYGTAPDPFTMGDFACRIQFDSSHIISSKARMY